MNEFCIAKNLHIDTLFLLWQYLPGSQNCGRIEHHRLGGQFEADIDRIQEIQKQIPLQYAELEEG